MQRYRRYHSLTRSSSRKSVALLHLFNRLAEYTLNRLQVGMRMRRRQETRISFLNMDTLLAHRVVQQTSQACIVVERKVKPRSEVVNPARNTAFHKEIIERIRNLGCLLVQVTLELRSGRLQMI